MDKSKSYTPVTELSAQDFPLVLRIFYNMFDNVNFAIASVVCAIICFSAMSPRQVFNYVFDGVANLNHLLLHGVIIGQTSDGKSFSSRIYKLLMKPILDRDKEAEREENEYAALVKTTAKSKDKPQEPVTVKICLNRLTKNKLVKRAHMMVKKYGEYLTFMMFTNELSTLVERRGSYGDLRDISKLAYDWDSEYSTDTQSESSYNATVDINFCAIWNTTPAIMMKFFDADAIESGNANRIIPMMLGDLLGESSPLQKPLTEKDLEVIHNTQNLLMSETYTENDQLQPLHEIQMQWLHKDEKLWCAAQLEIIGKTCSAAHQAFYKRASCSAARLTAMVYHLWGEKPCHRAKCRRIYYFFADKILSDLLKLFGKKYEKKVITLDVEQIEDETALSLYDQMPKRFSRDQLNTKVEQGEYGTKTRQFIYKWLKNHLIYETEEKNVYEKLY